MAKKDNHYLAAGLFLHWHQTLCYKYAASDDRDQDLRPNHLLTWEAINWGHENGYTLFDFGRTDIKNEGLRTFKCRWGADEKPLSYSVFSEQNIKASSGKITSLMNKVITNSPPFICRAAGELLYKHFG
jgi:CelD/BcsL family acetyltransferase involved in cellulose biosynthesis